MSQQPKPMKSQRDLDMFEEWISGKLFSEIAAKHNMSVQNVKRISMTYGWQERRAKITEGRYKKMIQSLKLETVKVFQILGFDAQKVLEDVTQNGRVLTKDERSHLSSYFDRLLKEVRLEDGKPTGGETNVVLGNTVTLQVSPEMAPAFGMFAKSSRAEIDVKAEIADAADPDDQA